MNRMKYNHQKLRKPFFIVLLIKSAAKVKPIFERKKLFSCFFVRDIYYLCTLIVERGNIMNRAMGKQAGLNPPEPRHVFE